MKTYAHDNLIESNGLARQSEINEFDDDQLDLIRDTMLDAIERFPKCNYNDELLSVINVCQQKLGCPTFKSVEQLMNNKSGLWTEIEED